MAESLEFEETLKRLVDRIAKILQAERCVFFLHDPAAGTLYPTFPALGFTREELPQLERRVSEDGVTSEVFRTNTPLILYDPVHDPRAAAEGWGKLGILNAVSVPLIVERRDDDNRVLSRTTVGVLHVFNKRNGHMFVDEDVRLLQRMAMTASAVIASAQMYREVVHERQELIHTIDSLNAGLLVIGTNGRLVQINPSARAILGISPNIPVIGLPLEKVVSHDRIRSLLETALTSSFPPGASEIADEIVVPVANPQPEDEVREHIYQIQCAPVRDDDGAPAGVVAIFNDITEIRGVERMKTAFISTVSHELRTPLTSIKGFISTLLQAPVNFYDEATVREFYTIIDSECDRLTRLIGDLLDISRIEGGRAMQMYWDRVNLPQLTEKVLAAQRAYTDKHVLVQDFSPEFPLIDADPDKMDQILTNLVSNAIKYSPKGGEVRVKARLISDGEPRVLIRVSDQGMGVSREHLSKLFDRFYRVDNRDNREIGGTGIGLALVKALVEAHGGQVTIDSEVGRGSTFNVLMPLNRKHTETASK